MKTKLKVTCGKFLHFTKRGCVGPYHYCVKPLPLFIAVSVPTHASERSCICVLEVMYLCVRGMDSVRHCGILELFRHWYFLFFYYILELFRQRGIFCFSIRFWKCFGSADRSALSPPAPPCDLECFIKIIPFLHCYSTQIHKSTVIMTRYPLFY